MTKPRFHADTLLARLLMVNLPRDGNKRWRSAAQAGSISVETIAKQDKAIAGNSRRLRPEYSDLNNRIVVIGNSSSPPLCCVDNRRSAAHRVCRNGRAELDRCWNCSGSQPLEADPGPTDYDGLWKSLAPDTRSPVDRRYLPEAAFASGYIVAEFMRRLIRDTLVSPSMTCKLMAAWQQFV